MFSGLIRHQGRVASIEGDAQRGITLRIEAADALRDGVGAGDSVALNGACLTVVSADEHTMRFDVVPETIARTTLGSLHVGDGVNVELSLRVGDRIGGHFVYGHIDGTASILAKEPEGQCVRLHLVLPDALAPFIVEKGYVAVDGVSVTVASTTGERFTVALIPETLRRTTFGAKGPGDQVNLEVDPIARYAQGAAIVYAQQRDAAPTADEVAWAYEI